MSTNSNVPKVEPATADAAAASSEQLQQQLPRSQSAPQDSLPHSQTPASQHAEPPVTLSQMTNILATMLREFQTTTLPAQVALAVQNAMRNTEPSPQLPSSTALPTAPSPTATPNLGNSFTSTPTINAANLGAKVKISTPANFTGARQVNVSSWLFEMDQYLTLCGVFLDSQRVAVASSYLKEAAFAWWEGVCRHSHPTTLSWIAFANAVRERFQPLAASRTARAQLRNLRQENTSVADYSNKFYGLVQLIPDMSDADQVEVFVHGLRRALAREVDLREPKVLHEAMTMAQKVETLLDTHRHYWRPSYTSSTTTSTYTSIPSSSSSQPSSNSTAMELGNLNLNDTPEVTADPEWTVEQEDEYNRYMNEGDNYEPRFDIWDGQESESIVEEKEQLQAIQQRGSRNYSAPYMPREELARCMKERLCLRCKKPGHIARSCPLPRNPASSHPKRNFQ
jgi:hypothetical protein